MSSKAECNTVFILGAGFSFDAGIPLMGSFVDTMWELAVRGSHGGRPLESSDRELFREANKIRLELNEYHGRASFDDRNIEDILSILSFNSYAEKRRSPDPMATIVKAIGRTIELTCKVEHRGIPPLGGSYSINETGPVHYRDFWKSLFKAHAAGKSLPCLITFNYDLVLERSLFQVLIGTTYSMWDKERPPMLRFRLRHHFPSIPDPVYEVRGATFGLQGGKDGTVVRTSPGANGDDPDVLDIELLKLHGSLNFPAPRQKKESSEIRFNTTDALPSPLILPPIFNKQSTESQRHIWSTALQRLRSAKNIVIVGYSLPRTDIYMQYFLKSALGPNGDLNRIFVFDPAMYSDGESAKEMKSRYQDCFSPQLKSRIHFKPDEVGADQPDYRTPIEDKQTRKLIFDPEAKDRMQWQLAKFGIRASVIYPGLDGVAKDVRAVCETARTGTIREVDPFRSMANWGR